jgi:hypothetical protein
MLVAARLLKLAAAGTAASAQCAPAPDSPYFFRELTQRRTQARLAEDRAFLDNLLSATFVDRARFIERELDPDRARGHGSAASVRNFSLLEHRKGFVVASYELVDGKTDHWFRDVYQVEDGRWRLASSEVVQGGT